MPAPLPAATLPTSDAIPPVLLAMQQQQEALFIASRTRHRQVIAAQGARPQPFYRPAPQPRWQRALRRLPLVGRAWQIRAIRASGLLDPDWYRAAYPDVAATGADPARHYLIHGAGEGRDPGPGFDTAHYLRLYPDVAAAGINPLIHYLTAGWDEGRSIHPRMPERQG